MSSQLEKYFYDIQVECPYGLPYTAIYRQARVHALPSEVMEFFLDAGFRRNGSTIYTMVCPDCQACVPIRLEPESFRYNRSQMRTWKKNQDLQVNINPLSITSEKLAICDKFLQSRFPGKGNAALDYYAGFFVNTMNYTYEVEFWDQQRLVGVSIIDLYPKAINCVYFYFDPETAKRSPGTFNILFLLEYARTHRIDYVYLGYLIREVDAMRYKANFKPHFLLLDGSWVGFDHD